MDKLHLLVCENFLPEVKKALELEGSSRLRLSSFPSFCDGGFSDEEISGCPAFSAEPGVRKILLCSQMCRAPRKDSAGSPWFLVRESLFCYTHLVGDNYAQFFSGEGYYVLSAGWLENWKERLARQGFTRDTAREFYQGWCRKLVFLDGTLDPEAPKRLSALSDYLEIPAKTIAVPLDSLRVQIRDLVSRGDLAAAPEGQDDSGQCRDLKELAAKNAAVLNIMSRIAVAEFKRDVITMLKEIWLIIFGAHRVAFWSHDRLDSPIPPPMKHNVVPPGQSFILNEETNTLYARLELGDKLFGILEVGDFLFPHHVDKYLDLFDPIIKIAALAISNAQRYEELISSRNRYEYSSQHDGLTGLFNRTYYKKLQTELTVFLSGGAFSIDLDGLKGVNDSLGHAAGDILIQAAAEVLKQTFRESDYILRMGGDEFTVIVREGDETLMENLSQRLSRNLEKASTSNDGPALSFSFGWSMSQGPGDTLEKVMQRADFLMYRDKRNKKSPQ